MPLLLHLLQLPQTNILLLLADLGYSDLDVLARLTRPLDHLAAGEYV